MSSPPKNIAIVGASGNLGTPTLAALVKAGKHNLTVITRASSTVSYPSSVTVKRGDYTDSEFLRSALRGQNVLILMLGFDGKSQAQELLVQAAAAEGVKYVLPAEYGGDSSRPAMRKALPTRSGAYDATHARMAELGLKWISVATGPWVEYCIKNLTFDISVPTRHATLYDDTAAFNCSTMPRIAASITAMLSLPEETLDEHFANSYLYVSSFLRTQAEIFAAVLRVTGTRESDWTIEHKPVQAKIDGPGPLDLLFGNLFSKDKGGDYNEVVHNDFLGLTETEDLDEVVRRAIA